MYWRIFCPKLGQVTNPERLTYTQILVKYPSPPGAETDTILETEKPLGTVERPLELERSRDCDMPVHRRQRNNNWTRQKKKKKQGVICFYSLGKSFRHFMF